MAIDPINESEILLQLEGDDELLLELIGIFLEDSDSFLNDVLSAVASHDSGKLERAAHRFKSSLGLFGDAEACKSALALEMMGRSNDLRDADSTCAIFKRQIEALVISLTSLKEKHVESSARGR